MVGKFMKRIREEETSGMGTVLRAYPPIFKTNSSAALLDMLVEEGPSSPKQVPAMVRYIHQWLMANDSAEHRLDKALLNLTRAQPDDAVVTLLRVAPSCDRAAMAMWKTIMCSPRTAEPVQLILLDVLGSWPEHSMCTSDGDQTGVFGLTATVVMWKILQEPRVPRVVTLYFPHLFVHLLFQVFFSTEEMPEEVDTFWKGCQEEHGLATSPNRFAVQTLQSLLCLLQCEHVVVSMEGKRGWDTLLCVDTHHSAVALLAGEMRHASRPLCKRIFCCLLEMLSKEMPYWDFPALAFLAEVLECLDLRECRDSIMDVLSWHLRRERADIGSQLLRALVPLRDHSPLAERMWSLTERLTELLQVRVTTRLLDYLFLDNGAPIPSPMALQLAKVFLPLFDNGKFWEETSKRGQSRKQVQVASSLTSSGKDFPREK
ncbi:maestro heat-like repeat-containing protein family member 1 [Geothlypis trichas]